MNFRFLFLAFSLFSLQSISAQNYFSSSSCSIIMRGIENEFVLQNDLDTNKLIVESIDCTIQFIDSRKIRISAIGNREASIQIRTKSTNTLLETKQFQVKNVPLPLLYVDLAEEGSSFLIKNGVITLQSPKELKPCFDPKYSIRSYELKIEGLEKVFSGEGDQISREQIMELVRHKSSYGKDKTLKVELSIIYLSPNAITRKKTVEYNY
jgi:hypothetical protein